MKENVPTRQMCKQLNVTGNMSDYACLPTFIFYLPETVSFTSNHELPLMLPHVLTYCACCSSDLSGGRSESESSIVHYIISCLSEGACQVYADNIVRIQHISAGMTRQLVADIGGSHDRPRSEAAYAVWLRHFARSVGPA